MSKRLLIYNRRRAYGIDARLLRQILESLLNELLRADAFNLAFYIVGAPEMTRLNETFLRHRGSTDVLAFDYGESPRAKALCGEIFLCADEAAIQAARFHTSWHSELVRYMIHGVLHLSGYDDHERVRRRRMKREEDRLLKELRRRFDFGKLQRSPAAVVKAGAANLKPVKLRRSGVSENGLSGP